MQRVFNQGWQLDEMTQMINLIVNDKTEELMQTNWVSAARMALPPPARR